MLDEVLNSTRVFGIVCERENVAEDEVSFRASIWCRNCWANSSF